MVTLGLAATFTTVEPELGFETVLVELDLLVELAVFDPEEEAEDFDEDLFDPEAST